jgi:hypothetical protein
MPLLFLERWHCVQRHVLSTFPEVALHEDFLLQLPALPL